MDKSKNSQNSLENLRRIFGFDNSISNIPEKSFQLSQSFDQETYEKEKSILTEEFKTISLHEEKNESFEFKKQKADTQQMN